MPQNLGGEIPESSQQLKTGITLLERYKILGIIGIGGMGAVYRAQDLHFPNVTKLVAIKEMMNQSPDPLVRQTIVRNFEREANLLATLDHRSIPRIYDYFTIGDRSYLVLEFINGKDLESLLIDNNGYFPEARVLAWALELCDVLEYLHNHKPSPIIFRDMKPSNVMVNTQDHIVLVDFGIAKTFQSGQKGTMIGTEGYSPPEQYRGEATPLADIYSLGATLHHILTGKDPRLEPPFSFRERPIRKINSEISSELEAVIFTALQYNAAERFQTITDFREALMGAARKTGLLNQAVSTIATRVDRGESVKPIWTFKCEDEVRGIPYYADGSLFVGSYDHNLYCLNARNGEFVWKYATDGGVVSRPIVYDNNVFFGSEDSRLHVVSARSGRLNWTYYAKGPIRSSPFIAESHAFIGSDDGHLHAVNTITGRAAWTTDVGAPVRSIPLVDHDLIYFGTEVGDFCCLDLSGKLRWRFKAKRAVTSSPVISRGIVYFGSVDATLYALDARTGWAIWRIRLGKPSISTPCLADKFLFTGAADGVIYAFEASSSREIWRFATEHQVTGSPIIYKDSLYCGSVDGHLYCLEFRTGRMRWKFKTQGPITGTPVANDDIIYIGSTDHHIYAIMA